MIDRLRCILCIFVLIGVMAAFLPWSLLLWNVFEVLFVAIQEKCSIKKAKQLLKENTKYQVTQDIDIESDYEDEDEELYSPTYSFLPINMYYDRDKYY